MAKALRRRQLWKALLLLDELRSRVPQLACMDLLEEVVTDVLGATGVERLVDRLPTDVLTDLARSVPQEINFTALHACLAWCIAALGRHMTNLDRRYDAALSAVVTALLKQHLHMTAPEHQIDLG